MFLLKFVESHSVQPKAQKDPQSDMWSSVSRCLSLLSSFLSGTLHLSLPELFLYSMRSGRRLCCAWALPSPAEVWWTPPGRKPRRSQDSSLTGLATPLPLLRPRSQVPRCLFSSVWKALVSTYFVQISSCLQWELTIPWDSLQGSTHPWCKRMYGQKLVPKLDLRLIKDSEKAVGSFWSAS